LVIFFYFFPSKSAAFVFVFYFISLFRVFITALYDNVAMIEFVLLDLAFIFLNSIL